MDTRGDGCGCVESEANMNIEVTMSEFKVLSSLISGTLTH